MTESAQVPSLLTAVWSRSTTFALVGLALLLFPFLLGSYQIYLLTDTIILGLFATGFNLLYGYTGLLSFGHAMFFAGSGYALAIFIDEGTKAMELSATLGDATPLVVLFSAMGLGVLVATVLAVPVGYLSVRLEEIYFALITLSFSMAFYTFVLQNYFGYTNGSNGITVILSRAEILGIGVPLSDRVFYYFFTLAFVLPSLYALWRIVKSPYGTVLTAIRENPDRASAIGIDVKRHRWASFVLSAAFSGLAGALYVPLHSVISPDYAHWSFSAEPVIMTVLGGPTSFLGPVAGAFVFRYLRWLVTQFGITQAHWQLVFGSLILVVLLFFKQGVAGGFDQLRQRLNDRLRTEDES